MDLEKPAHWETAKLEELAVLTLGGDWGKDADFESAEYSLAYCIRGAEFRNWDADRGSTASPRMIKNSSLLNRALQDGDILVEISGGGPEQPVGRTVLIDKTVLGRAPHIPKICTNFLRLLRPTQEIVSSYLNCYLTFFYRSGEIRNYQAGSNNLRNLKFNDYLGLEIPLPPLAEQHRIVAKIEELFSELDQGVASLKTAREQLKVYRQSLLKNAFEGKLTAAWRAAHRDQLETATTLQQRIARERQARYQQQLADWQTAGQSGPKPKPPKPLLPLTAEELAELPELPEGWGWGQIAGVSECLDSLRVPINKAERLKRQGEIPYYGANGQVGWIDDYLFDEPLILVVEDETFTGREKPFSYKVTGKSWVNNHAHILKPLAGIELDYLNYQLFFYPFTERTTGTTGRKKLTQEALMTSPVRVCSTLEQVEIVSQLESKLSEADQLDQTLATALQQADALRQSILKKAFHGQLVKQAKNEEPATALLERIRAGKSNGMNIPRSRRKSG